MTDPLRRHFNPRGPNYPPSGLDTPVRDAERREALGIKDQTEREVIAGWYHGLYTSIFGTPPTLPT